MTEMEKGDIWRRLWDDRKNNAYEQLARMALCVVAGPSSCYDDVDDWWWDFMAGWFIGTGSTLREKLKEWVCLTTFPEFKPVATAWKVKYDLDLYEWVRDIIDEIKDGYREEMAANVVE